MSKFDFPTILSVILSVVGIIVSIYYGEKLFHKKMKYCVLENKISESYIIALWNASSLAISREDLYFLKLRCTKNAQVKTIWSTDDEVPFNIEVQSKADDKSSEETWKKPAEGIEENPAEGIEENPAEGIEENPAEGIEENPAEGIEENPAEGIEENPAEGTGENPAEGTGENPAEGTGEKLAEGTGEKLAEEKSVEEYDLSFDFLLQGNGYIVEVKKNSLQESNFRIDELKGRLRAEPKSSFQCVNLVSSTISNFLLAVTIIISMGDLLRMTVNVDPLTKKIPFFILCFETIVNIIILLKKFFETRKPKEIKKQLANYSRNGYKYVE